MLGSACVVLDASERQDGSGTYQALRDHTLVSKCRLQARLSEHGRTKSRGVALDRRTIRRSIVCQDAIQSKNNVSRRLFHGGIVRFAQSYVLLDSQYHCKEAEALLGSRHRDWERQGMMSKGLAAVRSTISVADLHPPHR